jgi:hypothetical protein
MKQPNLDCSLFFVQDYQPCVQNPTHSKAKPQIMNACNDSIMKVK